MVGMNRQELEQRVTQAAEEALADHGYVSSIDVLVGANMLLEQHVRQWRQGRIDYLERMVQGNLKKISAAMHTFRGWAANHGLKPSETAYKRMTRDGNADLRFSVSGDPEIEKLYRTHYVSPALGEQKQEKLKQKLEDPGRPTVFQVVKDSACSECGVEIEKNDLLYLEAGQPLCLACAKMDDLEFLPSGDTALTRRATKHSPRVAVVVKFSRSRGRYERQGILVESTALAQAEEECAADAGERAQARVRAAAARERQDVVFTEEMTRRIQELFPRCPPEEARAIAAHASRRGSGRVGRSAAGRKLDERAMTLAVTASVRHRHTGYDELLAAGVEREQARARVGDRVREIVDSWR